MKEYTQNIGDQHLIGLDDKKFDRRQGGLEPTIIDLRLVLARNNQNTVIETHKKRQGLQILEGNQVGHVLAREVRNWPNVSFAPWVTR
jgi:hypothetical protein